jgi:hypothetical protein
LNLLFLPAKFISFEKWWEEFPFQKLVGVLAQGKELINKALKKNIFYFFLPKLFIK